MWFIFRQLFNVGGASSQRRGRVNSKRNIQRLSYGDWWRGSLLFSYFSLMLYGTEATPPPLEKCNSFLLCSFVVHKRLIISFDIQLSQVTYNEATSTQHQQQRRGGLKGRLGQRRGWDREGGVSLIVWHLLGVSTPVAPSSLPPSSTPPPLSALEKRQGSLKLLKSPLFNPRHPPTPLLNYIFHTRSLLLPPFVQSSSFCGLNFFE